MTALHVPTDADTTRDTEDALARLGDQVRRLAADVDGPLRRVRLSTGDLVVEVEWDHTPPAPAVAVAPLAPVAPLAAAVPAVVAAPVAVVPADVPVADDTEVVTSPMVGTFYHCPAPGEPPFVSVGQQIEVGQTIGIVEAMKLLNPIEAEVAGEVVEVVVADGAAVEYAQPLVRVRPIANGD